MSGVLRLVREMLLEETKSDRLLFRLPLEIREIVRPLLAK